MLEQKIAHLGMIQGVIGRMASDSQTLKTLAITVAAAIIALGQTQGATATTALGQTQSAEPSYLPLIAVLPILIFWGLTARQLHVERAYRRLYDAVRLDEEISGFSMDWREFRKQVAGPFRLAFSLSVASPYIGVVIILVAVWLYSGGHA
ncbi:hypothetical protein [Mesorhizobium sp.]|uniref:hypothetical protein n=1 Tax=Mesorhizobium sp. TaxID=1871066 RepID=UPI000FE4D6BE|nr:hypothetical protein [Mesorhizobium sp.]RWP30695.1 MAG: hypothetical protein EOR03_24245 [Mesorhizobium sp.]